jgi:hypothetical protein
MDVEQDEKKKQQATEQDENQAMAVGQDEKKQATEQDEKRKTEYEKAKREYWKRVWEHRKETDNSTANDSKGNASPPTTELPVPVDLEFDFEQESEDKHHKQHSKKANRPVELQFVVKTCFNVDNKAASPAWILLKAALDKQGEATMDTTSHQQANDTAQEMDTHTLEELVTELYDITKPDPKDRTAGSAKRRRAYARQRYEATMRIERMKGEHSDWRYPKSDDLVGKHQKSWKQIGLNETRQVMYRELLSANDREKWKQVWQFIMPNTTRRNGSNTNGK